jgi:glycosyltransferase involved in cell wall biosynthesis
MAGLVVITPVFEDAAASLRLFRELKIVLDPAPYVVAVDDGSVRDPLDVTAIASAGLEGLVIRLTRNVGHQRAIAVGINYVADHLPDATCVVMDSDGEDVPSTIPLLLEALASQDVDIVVGQRKSRVESLRFRAFYAIYKVLFWVLSGRRISFGNFMALSSFGLKRVAALPELWVHVASSVLTSRLRVAFCPIDRGPRYAGRSKMDFSGLVLHGLKALMVFPEDVLVRVGLVCAGIGVLSVLAMATVVILKLSGLGDTPGWFSTALGILLLALLQTGTLTLMTLMLSGIVRNFSLVRVNYQDMIDAVIEAPRIADAAIKERYSA